METKREKSIKMLMQKLGAIRSELYNRTVVVYDPLTVAVYSKKATRPTYHYKFKTESEFYNYLQKIEKDAEDEKLRDEIWSKQYKEIGNKIQPGEILISSWGYEQTNIDFYIVLSRKNDFVTIQEIGQQRRLTGDMSGLCKPDQSITIGEPFRRKINRWGGVNLESYKSCVLWDGREYSWSSYA